MRGGGRAAAAAAAAGGAGGVCPDEFFRVNAYVLCLSFENMRAIRKSVELSRPTTIRGGLRHDKAGRMRIRFT